MQIKRLKIINFRNYVKNVVDFDSNINIFLGHNAQGKTNLLEAIYYLSGGKSNRTFKDQELIRWDQTFFNISADLNTINGNYNLMIMNSYEGRKKIKINGLEQKKIPEDFKTVIFSPDDLTLIKGSPSGRRDFLDREISQISSVYSKNLSDYYKILRQRNKVLKLDMNWNKKEENLSLWDEQLIHKGSLLLKKRLEMVHQISILSRLIYRRLTNNRENIKLDYSSSLDLQDISNIEEIKFFFSQQLKKLRNEELRSRFTLIGPHRDDLNIFIDQKSAKNYASQGQQRTCILALKLSILEIVKGNCGEYPVLLLDDVFSELDDSRKSFLVQEIKKGIQTFITGTMNEQRLKNVNIPVKLFRINQGDIKV
ncbi:DNA replication/repair protein RecF [Candidatus Contubernalis alkaliaceticus]|uniref:DNA replication/repair protein RecF n=1 Tax=Candidatus Contubernalis alkaliaceticus TaxID=338645 RepID=UPI001F4BE511|nr:DNA replication/repair protein RecF [Candidatus Contubernalis alkalaceticus]UNC90614.1 DNA replication/repair protein RecF [Candidatus Contubernalis alkalaceticus]